MDSSPHESQPASKKAFSVLLYNEGKNQGKREKHTDSRKVSVFVISFETVTLLLHEKVKKPIAFFMKA